MHVTRPRIEKKEETKGEGVRNGEQRVEGSSSEDTQALVSLSEGSGEEEEEKQLPSLAKHFAFTTKASSVFRVP